MLHCRYLILDPRAVGLLDLGLLVVANSVMRTRLPPSKDKDNSSSVVKDILTDVAFLVYMAGNFLVSLAFISSMSTH
jgi:hypothetical protein